MNIQPISQNSKSFTVDHAVFNDNRKIKKTIENYYLSVFLNKDFQHNQGYFSTSNLMPLTSSLCALAVVGILYAEEKERLDFVYTIYHWWQAIAIFVVYLWSHMPMRASFI